MPTKQPFFLSSIPWRRWFLLLGLAFSLTGCWNDMVDQPRYKPLAPSEFFPDGRSARPFVDGTIPQTGLLGDEPSQTGRTPEGDLLATSPVSVTLELTERGRERYDIFCSPCHGYDGYGQGMIVQRGFAPPPSLHQDRLRQVSDGHLFDVITNGFGQMYAYDYRIKPEDRWAIVAYIRALQLSQSAPQNVVPPEAQGQMEGQP